MDKKLWMMEEQSSELSDLPEKRKVNDCEWVTKMKLKSYCSIDKLKV